MSENKSLVDDLKAPDTKAWEGGCLWTGIGVFFGSLAFGLLFVIVSLTRVSRIEQNPELIITVIAPATKTPLVHTSTPEGRAIQDEITATSDHRISEVYSEGDLVEVRSLFGKIQLKACLTVKMRPDTICVPQGWEAANANELTGNKDSDPISGFPNLKSAKCSIHRL